ncbi:hypothetical protein ABZ372_18170, partial [Streptomyces sp. NPDC005921]
MPDSDKKNQAAEVREFLSTRRARITPEQAGLPVHGGGNRRVAGLRREEVARTWRSPRTAQNWWWPPPRATSSRSSG